MARRDLLLGPLGQGLFHWGEQFDDDHSPMDYDGVGRHPRGKHRVADDDWTFCQLDPYLMGLLPPSLVGRLEVRDGRHRYRWGSRTSSWRTAHDGLPGAPPQRRFKDAFVVVTDRLE